MQRKAQAKEGSQKERLTHEGSPTHDGSPTHKGSSTHEGSPHTKVRPKRRKAHTKESPHEGRALYARTKIYHIFLSIGDGIYPPQDINCGMPISTRYTSGITTPASLHCIALLRSPELALLIVEPRILLPLFGLIRERSSKFGQFQVDA